ncbi:DUF222 domain-containing protein [Herbiconiux sp. P17]|uniref:HNH endonuclease signature motif containing protein n=1 Tax=Herbiconiux wuyangfengii TaxID=3342794 RepID=UPI0035B8F6AA
MNESGMRIDAILDDLVAEETIRAASSARTAVLLAEATRLRLAESRPDEQGLAMRSLTAEIACATRVPEGTVIRLLNDAEILVHTLPATLEALSAGTISYRHAQVMVAGAVTLPHEARGAFEEALLPVAVGTTAARFERAARRERERLHPETIETRTATAIADRSVALTPDADGMAWLTCHLPAVAAVAIDTRLTRIARAAHTGTESRTHTQLRADALTTLLLGTAAPRSAPAMAAPALAASTQAAPSPAAAPPPAAAARPVPPSPAAAPPPAAAARPVPPSPSPSPATAARPVPASPAASAQTPTPDDRAATPRADHASRAHHSLPRLADLTQRQADPTPSDDPSSRDDGLDAGEGSRFVVADEFLGVVPTVVLTVPALSLLGHDAGAAELHGFGPIDIDTARKLAARAPSFVRILTHPDTGETLSVGRTRYRPPPDLRLALLLDDETCRFPNCNRRAESCELDHTTDWAYGGDTARDNLHHLCPKHHHLKHDTTGWSVTARPSRTLDWRSPTGRHYTTTPMPPPRNAARPTFTTTPDPLDVVA